MTNDEALDEAFEELRRDPGEYFEKVRAEAMHEVEREFRIESSAWIVNPHPQMSSESFSMD